MPTLQEIANQIKEDLDQIKSSTALTAGRITTLTQHLDAGVNDLAQGLFAILEVDRQCAVLLADNVQQNQAILCWLEIQADLQCRILRRLETLVTVDTGTRDTLARLERVLALVHAREALEVERLDAAEARIAACCPPIQVDPLPCFQPCQEPKIQHHEPKGQDWEPHGKPGDVVG